MPRTPGNPAEDFYRDSRCRCNHLTLQHDLDGCHAGDHNDRECACLGYEPVLPVATP